MPALQEQSVLFMTDSLLTNDCATSTVTVFILRLTTLSFSWTPVNLVRLLAVVLLVGRVFVVGSRTEPQNCSKHSCWWVDTALKTIRSSYTPCPEKKGTNSILGITSSNTDRFSTIFHFYNLQRICNKTVVKYPIAPITRHYTTLWNNDVRKLACPERCGSFAEQ